MKLLRLTSFIVIVLFLFIASGCVSHHRNTSWYMEQIETIEKGNHAEHYEKIIGIFIIGFFNNENIKKFSPGYIHYITIDFIKTEELVVNNMAKKRILVVPSTIISNELLDKQSDKTKKQVRDSAFDILSIIDEYIQTTKFNEDKVIKLSFPSLAALSSTNLQWNEKYPIYVIVGLETQKHDKPEHVLSSALGVVRFSGEGNYHGMYIIPYDFTNINNYTFANKIISSIFSAENKIDSLKRKKEGGMD